MPVLRRLVDVWGQLPGTLDRLPEVKRLLEQSTSPIYSLLKNGYEPPQLIDRMDEAGVEKAFISAWTRPEGVVCSNEEVYRYVKYDPNRFVGLGAINLTSPMKALEQVDQCVDEYGFKGIRVVNWLWNLPITANYYYPILARCVQLDVPFCTQVGHTGPLCPSETGRPIPYVDQVALDFPDLKLVCGHIGYPWTDEMIGCAWKHANVYIDTSAHAPDYYPPQLVHFMNTYGAKKVMFGTNFPQLDWKTCADQAVEMQLKPKTMEAFLWGNASRVFKLGMSDTKKAKL